MCVCVYVCVSMYECEGLCVDGHEWNLRKESAAGCTWHAGNICWMFKGKGITLTCQHLKGLGGGGGPNGRGHYPPGSKCAL